MHTSLTGVSTSYLDPNVSLVACWLFLFSFFGRLVVYIIFQKYLLALRFCDLKPFSILQKGGVFLKHLVPELLEILKHSLPFLLLFCKHLYKTGLYTKVEKYKFHSVLVEYLEHIISPSSLTMSDDKMKIIQD